MKKKFIDSVKVSDYKVLTDTGYVDIEYIHKTIEYQKYVIKTDSGITLECADTHILFDSDLNEVFVKDLKIGDTIITSSGSSVVQSIDITSEFENMYDLELSDDSNHRYYTNDVLSHNTHLVRTISTLLDVPFTIVDATVFTEAGYVGEDVESILTRLLQACNYDVKKAEMGIVYVDEADKLSRKGKNPSITRDVNGEGVQQALLKMLEGTDVLVPPQGGRKHPDAQMISMNTQNILFIFGGAFDGIEDIIKRRMNTKTIGFKTNKDVSDDFDEDNVIKYITHQDLRAYGYIPELIGRLPVLVYLESLKKEQLKRILTEPKNAIIKQYKKLMQLDGIDFNIEDSVYDYIVDKSIENETGARGLRAITENVMQQYMYDAPSMKDTKTITIDMDYIKTYIDNKYVDKTDSGKEIVINKDEMISNIKDSKETETKPKRRAKKKTTEE